MDKPSNNEARALWQARNRLTVLADGIVRYNNYKGRSTKDSPLGKNCQLLVVLPQSLRRRYLELVHDSPLGGHMGRDRTWDRVRTMGSCSYHGMVARSPIRRSEVCGWL